MRFQKIDMFLTWTIMRFSFPVELDYMYFATYGLLNYYEKVQYICPGFGLKLQC